jgi:hypothetical protein
VVWLATLVSRRRSDPNVDVSGRDLSGPPDPPRVPPGAMWGAPQASFPAPEGPSGPVERVQAPLRPDDPWVRSGPSSRPGDLDDIMDEMEAAADRSPF